MTYWDIDRIDRRELPEGCHRIFTPSDSELRREYLGQTEGGGQVFIIHPEEDSK